MLTLKDRDKFINDGEFFEKYPDIYPEVTRYERFDSEEHLIESWERGEDGRMHNVTERDRLRIQIIKAKEELAKLEVKDEE